MTTRGLTEAEASARRASGAGNNARLQAGRSYASIVRRSVLTPLNGVLFAVAALLVALGLALDAAVTALPVLLNVGVNAGLEASAKHRLDRLRILSAPRAVVLREGRQRSVDPADLVQGDLIVIGRGDQVVLDGDVVEGEVEVDESLLSGESDPVVRRVGDPLLSGSACVAGRATMRVSVVGAATYASALTAQAQAARDERTPLQHDADRLIAGTAALVVLVSGIVAATAGRHTPIEAAQAGAVLVALVPQGIAVIVTVTYALAALRVSRAGALVQRISAVEAMGRVDTLVLDKTGTITAPRFDIRDALPILADEGERRRLLDAAVDSLPVGDRVGDAIRRWLGQSDDAVAPAPAERTSAGPRAVDGIAFSSARRWSGALLDGAAREAVVLGAPEVLLGNAAGPAVADTVFAWGDRGLRVVALMRARGATLRSASGEPQLPAGLEPVCLLGFAEELRPDAPQTLAAFAAEGVALKVVSGDDPRTVAAIARSAGLPGSAGQPETGSSLEVLEDAGLLRRVEAASVVGRVAPPLKARLVRVLRAGGHSVAMVGDGVNDILALRAANLGVAMGTGSSASKAVADIVLLDDRFAVLPAAVREGRRIVAGMTAATSLLLSRTLYMLVIVLVAALSGLPFPFTPRGSSLLALVTVGLPGLAAVAWARPMPPESSLVRATLRFAVPAAAAVAAIALPVYALWLHGGASLMQAQSALVTITVSCGTLLIPFLATSGSSPEGPAARGRHDWRPVALALAMVGVYGTILSLPLARWLFELQPLPFAQTAQLAALALLWAGVVAGLRALVTRWVPMRAALAPRGAG